MKFSIWLVLVLLTSGLFSQQQTIEPQDREEDASAVQRAGRSVLDVDFQNLDRTNERLVPQRSLVEQVLENEIDSSAYILGPGDQLLIEIRGGIQSSFLAPVTAEGFVILAGFGERHVAGMTLTEAIKSLKSFLADNIKRAQFSIRLAYIRKFRIFVVGEVQNPGTYLLRAVDRASDAIQLAEGLIGWGDDTRIQLRRTDGTTDTLNISRFFLEGDLDHNPQLRGGDVLYVPPIDLEKRYVIVEGNVGSQGVYQVNKGETLLSFLGRVRAINRRSDIENLVLIREGNRRQFNLFENESAAAEEELQRGDRIMIPTNRDKVYVRGEVGNTGAFPFRANYSVMDYAGEAGMLETAVGNFDKLYVVRAGTGEIELGSNLIVRNGDTVVVPRRGRETVKDYVLILTPLISIGISIFAIFSR